MAAPTYRIDPTQFACYGRFQYVGAGDSLTMTIPCNAVFVASGTSVEFTGVGETSATTAMLFNNDTFLPIRCGVITVGASSGFVLAMW